MCSAASTWPTFHTHLYFDGAGLVSRVSGEAVGKLTLSGVDLHHVVGVFNRETLVSDGEDEEDSWVATEETAQVEAKVDKRPRRKSSVVVATSQASTLQNLREQVQHLMTLQQPAQRTPEWYAMRKTRLTASDLATALGESKYNTRFSLLEKKIGMGKKFTGNFATEWGVKYEPVATEIYERRNGVRVVEFGLLPHPTISFLGASPDGIVFGCQGDCPGGQAKASPLDGHMLEIKVCPASRLYGRATSSYMCVGVHALSLLGTESWCARAVSAEAPDNRHRPEGLLDADATATGGGRAPNLPLPRVRVQPVPKRERVLGRLLSDREGHGPVPVGQPRGQAGVQIRSYGGQQAGHGGLDKAAGD